MTPDADLAIVGSGFGGSILAMVASRLGRRVLLIERGEHPRFAIGESASPLAGLLLETLAARYDLPRLAPLAAFGPWRRTYPDLTCGLKRGFTFYRHQPGVPFRHDPRRTTELLVAASPNDEVSDTHWLRADVDHFLVREAMALGVEYLDRTRLEGVEWDGAGRARLTGTREGRPLRLTARAVVDASGPHGFLVRALGLGTPGFAGYPATQALYSHFTGVARCDELAEFASEEIPPYPPDAAALHHVFEDGWMWVLRFENGVTSAGIAATSARASRLRLSDGPAAWSRLLDEFPSVARQFAGARPIRAFTCTPCLPFRAAVAAGPAWALLPSAAAFVDPLFSTGFPLTLLGIERLAAAMEAGALGGRSMPDAASESRLSDYARATLSDADRTARFVAGAYAGFPRFDDFVAYSMLYFATASFTETARRLGGRGAGFLGGDDARVAEAIDRLSPARGAMADRAEAVASAVRHVNVAGLCRPARRNWYPVKLQDLVEAAPALGATPEALRALWQALVC